MGKTFSTGLLTNGLWQDASNNIGIGGSPSGTYKLEVTGTAKVSSTLLVSGAATFGSTITASGNLNLQAGAVRNINFYDSSNTNINAQIQYDQISATSGQLFFGTNNAGTFATRLTIASTGAATFAAATGGAITLTTNGSANNWTSAITGSSTTSQSYGLLIQAGTNSTDAALRIRNQANTLDWLFVRGDGNVGIGTTTPDNLLVVSGGTGSMKLEATTTNRSAIQIFNTANTLYIGVDNASASYFGYAANSANIQTLNYPIIFSNGSGTPLERMRIGTSGDADIRVGGNFSYHAGTNRGTININGATSAMLSFSTAATTNKGYIYHNGTYMEVWNVDNSYLDLGTNNISRLKITNTGQSQFKHGETNLDVVTLQNSSASPFGMNITFTTAAPNGTSNNFVYFADATNGLRFRIPSNGNVYSTSTSIVIISSDEKLKTDIRDYDKGLAEILAMKPRIYKRKNNLEVDEVGFIAQEMDIALAGSMIESYKDEDGESINTYKLEWYPLLVKAIQEQQAIITSLQEQINELKNK